jgi:uncharacterized protein YuzE
LVASDVLTLEFALRVKDGMKLKVDQKADALYLSLSEAPASRSEEVSPGIIVDYDEQDRVVGVEMLYLSKRAPGAEVNRLLFESIPQVG